MSQVEPLVLPVDTRQVEKGEKALDGLTSAGGRAQKATDSLRASQDKAKSAMASAAAQTDSFISKLERQISTHGRSASEIMKYDAAMLGMTRSQRQHTDAMIKAMESQERQIEQNAAAAASMQAIKVAAVAVATAVAAAFVTTARAVVAATMEMEQSMARLDAVVRATGYAAGLTASDIEDLVQQIEGATLFDDTAIRDATSVLLTFKSVQGETFRETVKVAADLAAVMRTDISSATMMLGKALENPVQGLTALSRAGVSFSAEQKRVIGDMVLLGQQGAAMTEILRVLKSQGMDGVAESMRTGLSGATKELADKWDDLLKELGKTDTVQTGLVSFLKTVGDEVERIKNAVTANGFLGALNALAAYTPGGAVSRLIRGDAEPSGPNRQMVSGYIQGRDPRVSGAARQAAEMQMNAEIALAERNAEAIDKWGKDATAAYEQVTKKARDWIAALALDTQQVGLNAQQKKALEAATLALTVKDEALRMAIMAGAAAYGARVTAIELAAEATKRLQAQEDNYAELLNQRSDREMDATKALEDKLIALQDETAALTMSDDALKRSLILRDLEAKKITIGTEAYEEYKTRIESAMGALADAREVKKATDAQVDMWKSIDRTAHDTFVSILDGGKDTATRLRDTFKNVFFDWLYQMTLKPFLVNVSAQMSGTNVAGQAFNGVNASGILSSGGWMGNMAAEGVVGGTVGTIDAGLIALQSGNIAGGLASLAGPVGAGIAVLSMLGAFENEPDTVRARLAFGQSGYTDNAGMTTRYGTAGFLDAENFSGKAAQTYIAALSADLDRLTSSFDNTDEVVQLLTTALAGVEFPSLDTGHTTEEWLSSYATQANQAVLEAAAAALNISTEDVLARVQGADKAAADKATGAAAAKEAELTAAREAAASAAQAAAEAERYGQQVASERYGLEGRLLQLQGNTAALRERESTALDYSNRPLLARIFALEDEQAATEALTTWRDREAVLTGATTEREIALRDALATTTDETVQAIIRNVFALEDQATAAKASSDAWQKFADAAMTTAERVADGANRAVDTAFAAVERAVTAERDRLQTVRDDAKESLDTLTGVFETITDGIAALRGTARASSQQSIAEARAFLASGSLDGDQIKMALQTVAGDRAENYATRQEYERVQLIQANELERLGDYAGVQRDAAQMALDTAESQLTALEDQLDLAQLQLDALHGVDTSIVGVGAAIAALATAYSSGAQVVGSASGATAAQYNAASVNNLIDRAASGQMDTVGAFQSAVSYGASLDTIASGWNAKTGESVTANDLTTWARANGVPGFDVGTPFVPRDMLAVVHRGEKITPAPQNDEQTRLLSQIAAGVANSARDARTTATILTRVTRDGESLLTTAA